MTKQDPRFVKGSSFVIENAPVKWAKVVEPDAPTAFKCTPFWCVDVILSDAWKKELEDLGMKVKQDGDGDWYIRAKRTTKTSDGVTLQPPQVVGPTGNDPFTEPIGNGTICNVEVYAKYNSIGGVTHLTPKLNRLRVVNHVPYNNSVEGVF